MSWEESRMNVTFMDLISLGYANKEFLIPAVMYALFKGLGVAWNKLSWLIPFAFFAIVGLFVGGMGWMQLAWGWVLPKPQPLSPQIENLLESLNAAALLDEKYEVLNYLNLEFRDGGSVTLVGDDKSTREVPLDRSERRIINRAYHVRMKQQKELARNQIRNAAALCEPLKAKKMA